MKRRHHCHIGRRTIKSALDPLKPYIIATITFIDIAWVLLSLSREFRRGADAVAAAWRVYPEVIAVSLIGSAARAPWKEVPRFGPYRRARVHFASLARASVPRAQPHIRATSSRASAPVAVA